MKLYTEGYGPYSDKFRIRAVAIAEIIGYQKAAAYCKCSEASIRTWTKVFANGQVQVDIERV